MLLKRFGKSLLIASLALLAPAVCASVGLAQAPSWVNGWTRFEQLQGRYAVSFPVTQFSQLHTKPDDNSADADIDGARYFVVCMDLHDIGPVENFLDDLETYAARANHATIVRKATVTLQANAGREVELENETGWQRITRDFIVNNRLYVVGAQARARKLNRDTVNQFVDSFELLAGPAPPPTVAPAPPAGSWARPVRPSGPAPSMPAPSAVEAPPVPAPPVSAPPVPAPSAEVPLPPAPQPGAPQSFQWIELAPPRAAAPPAATETPAGDHRYKNRDGRYLVDFPSAPTESQRPLRNGTTLHQALSEEGGVAFCVTYCDLPADDLDWARSRPEGPGVFHSGWRDEVIRQTHATVKSEGTVRNAGREAYEVDFVLPDGTHLIGRMVLLGSRCYRVVLAGMGLTRDMPRVRDYLDSFGIIE